MLPQIIVKLSYNGESLELFARQHTARPIPITSIETLDKVCKDWWIVKHERTLLEALIKSNHPLNHYEVLSVLNDKIQVEHDLAKKENLEAAFEFCQVCNGEDDVLLSYIPGVSSSTLPEQVRKIDLWQAISTIHVGYLEKYGIEKRNDFIRGRDYENTSILNPSWIVSYALTKGGEEFEAGRQAARMTNKM